MSAFVIDIETDGPIPGDYSMIQIGAVVIKDKEIKGEFFKMLPPITPNSDQGALLVLEKTREQLHSESSNDPLKVMLEFNEWVINNNEVTTNPMFFSDNNGFDWSFVNWYFIHFLGIGKNPFGHSSRNINDIYKGVTKSMMVNFKHLRITAYNHNALHDAIGNAEALIQIAETYNIKGLLGD